jgi:hypothetical protein
VAYFTGLSSAGRTNMVYIVAVGVSGQPLLRARRRLWIVFYFLHNHTSIDFGQTWRPKKIDTLAWSHFFGPIIGCFFYFIFLRLYGAIMKISIIYV